MNEKAKKIFFIIATVLFIVSICFIEVRMIYDSIDAYFNGTTGGIRFFGDQTPYFGLKGAKKILEGWGVGILIWYSPILLYQIIYLFIILKEKYKSIKNNIMGNIKNEKPAEKPLSTMIYIWLAILLIFIFIISQFNFLSSIIFNEYISTFFSILLIAEITTLIYLVITEFIIIATILLGIVLIFVINLDNWPLMIVFQLYYYFFFTLAFVIIEECWKRRKLKSER